MINRIFLIILISIFVGGCVTPHASGPRFLQIGEVETRNGYSTLYIYRTYDHFEENFSKEVYLNDVKVVGLLDSGYTVIYIKPGEYRVRIENTSKWLTSKDPTAKISILPETKNFLRFYVKSNYSAQISGVTIIGGIPSMDIAGNQLEQKRWIFQERSDIPQPLKGCRYIAPYTNEVSP